MGASTHCSIFAVGGDPGAWKSNDLELGEDDYGVGEGDQDQEGQDRHVPKKDSNENHRAGEANCE